MKTTTWVAIVLALVGALSISGGALAQTVADEVTFSEDVAPILQANCQECHRPSGIGPMSLLTYQDARPFAPLIKHQVETRTMPPWHVDRTIGIQEFKNDLSLTNEEIQTIVAWVDGGAPEGDPVALPAPVAWPDGASWLLEGRDRASTGFRFPFPGVRCGKYRLGSVVRA